MPAKNAAPEEPVPEPKHFPVSKAELAELADFANREAYDKLKHYGGVKALAEKLGTDLEKGLVKVDNSKHKRVEQYGENKIPKPDPTPLWQLILNVLGDYTIIVLLIGATVNTVLGAAIPPHKDWLDGVAIFIAVGIITFVTAGNDYAKEKQFRKILELEKDREVKVIRDGLEQMVSSYDIVVGDVVCIFGGCECPCDGIVIEAKNLLINESALTGEPDALKKTPEEPLCWAATEVTAGSGTILCVAVGINTGSGELQAELMAKSAPDTPLQVKLGKIAAMIGYGGLAAAIVTFLALLIRLMVDRGVFGGENTWDHGTDWNAIVRYFVIAVTIMVVAIPEGLPMAVTISLAFGMLKMIDDQVFVRKLAASETMGSATCVCSDKTGTLTQNKMTLTSGLVGKTRLEFDKDDKTKLLNFKREKFPEMFDIFVKSMALNTTCFYEEVKKKDPVTGREFTVDEGRGPKTELPLLQILKQLDVDYKKMRTDATTVRQYEFNSVRKRMSTLVQEGKQMTLFVKGGSDVILDLCTDYRDDSGKKKSMNKEVLELYNNAIGEMADQGLRTLCIAMRDGLSEGDLPSDLADDDNPDAEAIYMERELTLVALIGLMDPLRPEVKLAITQCKVAGITVRMITGDNRRTATSIAKEAGILYEDDHEAMDGEQYRALPDDERRKRLAKIRVMSRSLPMDKVLLVNDLKFLGEIVAVTGDGTNDALALKEAQVGFAMGIMGTDVAKNASDIVILDDNFASIVNAIKWGRNIYDSIRKFLQFQLSVNIVCIVMTLVGAIYLGDSPLSPVQLLWVNLIMDTLGALALATEPPSDDILERPPNHPQESPLSRSMIVHIAAVVTYELTAVFILIFSASTFFEVGPWKHVTVEDENGDPDHVGQLLQNWNNGKILTILFTVFIVLQLSNEFLARHLDHNLNLCKRMMRAKQFPVLIFIIALIQFLSVNFAGAVTQTMPLSPWEWFICLLIGGGMIVWGWIVNALVLFVKPLNDWMNAPFVPKAVEDDGVFRCLKCGNELEEDATICDCGSRVVRQKEREKAAADAKKEAEAEKGHVSLPGAGKAVIAANRFDKAGKERAEKRDKTTITTDDSQPPAASSASVPVGLDDSGFDDYYTSGSGYGSFTPSYSYYTED